MISLAPLHEAVPMLEDIDQIGHPPHSNGQAHRETTSLYVMLPLDTINGDGVFAYVTSAWFAQALNFLAASGAYGVAVDVWWGAVEREPGLYHWGGYKQLFDMIKQTGLKLQVVLSFHACGGNVGDTAHVPLPSWVVQCGDTDPDLWHTDRPQGGCPGQRNKEYVSIWADEASGVLCGRSPLQCYEDFMLSFKNTFEADIGCMVEEIVVGAGPCGELRYPSYVESNGWKFPGVGEFQCYDRRALASLSQVANEAGHPEWGYGGPHDTGDYNSCPEETGFYNHEGSWDSPYGHFFLEWYSNSLIKHGELLMEAARRTFASSTPSPTPKNTSTSLMKTSAPSSEASTDTQVLISTLGPFSHQQVACTQVIAGAVGHRQHLKGIGISHQNHQQRPLLIFEGIPTAVGGGLMGQMIQNMSSGQVSDVDICSIMEEDASMTFVDGRVRQGSGISDLRCQEEDSMIIPVDEVQPHSSSGQGHGALIEQGSSSSDVVVVAAALEAKLRAEAEATALLKAGLFALPLGLSSALGSRGDHLAVMDHHTPATALAPSPSSSLPDASMPILASLCMDPQEASTVTLPASLPDPPSISGVEEEEEGADMRHASSQRGASSSVVVAAASSSSPGEREPLLTLKIAGIHWWFRSRSHAAELTAGYYNTATRDGYVGIVDLCARHRFGLTLTCIEMCDTQHPPSALCGPEGLLKQIRSLCAVKNVPLAGENALPIFLPNGGVDTTALDRIIYNTRPWHGAAVMAAYWSTRGTGGVGGGDRHSPDSSVHEGGSSSLLTSLPRTGLYRHTVHPSVNCLLSSYGQKAGGSDQGYLGSPVSSSGKGTGPMSYHGASGGRGMFASSGALHAATSDPAIAATGLRADSYADISDPLPPMRSFTFLRLGPEILQGTTFHPWTKFVWRMREGGFC